MEKRLWVIALTAVIVLSMALYGCKGKTEKLPETSNIESPEVLGPSLEERVETQATEPIVAIETIPPTASPQGMMEKPVASSQVASERNKDIQRALKNANFYAGTVDGKIGPRTKKAIEEFQKSKGLKADGKVGPKTWAELEKYLNQ